MAKIKKGDDVVVLTGKDNGKRGKVVAVLGDRVRVEGVNMVKKHVKPNPMTQQAGGIVERESTIHVSNVAIYNSATGKADRIGYQFVEGKKVRVFKSNGARVDA